MQLCVDVLMSLVAHLESIGVTPVCVRISVEILIWEVGLQLSCRVVSSIPTMHMGEKQVQTCFVFDRQIALAAATGIRASVQRGLQFFKT